MKIIFSSPNKYFFQLRREKLIFSDHLKISEEPIKKSRRVIIYGWPNLENRDAIEEKSIVQLELKTKFQIQCVNIFTKPGFYFDQDNHYCAIPMSENVTTTYVIDFIISRIT